MFDSDCDEGPHSEQVVCVENDERGKYFVSSTSSAFNFVDVMNQMSRFATVGCHLTESVFVSSSLDMKHR